MDNIEQELVCCVCLDLYDTPVILPCSHNLCKGCARGLSDNSGITRRIFDCPKCRHEVRISPAKGLDGLPENLALKSIVAAVRKHKKDKQIREAAENKNCLKHGQELGYYCKSCRLVICETCLKEVHLGYGHQVSPAADVLEDEQEKANVCAAELRRILSLLEEQHKAIMKKKDRLTHFERNLQKSLDYEFQQVILNANMTKMALTCAVQKMYKDSRESVIAEERQCQELLTEATQLMKVLEDSDRARELERKIQKLETFVTKQSGLMTFKLGSYSFDVKEEHFPVIKLTGVDGVKKAVEMVKWSREDMLEDKVQVAKETEQEVKVFPSSRLTSSSSASAVVSHSCDNHQRATDTVCKNAVGLGAKPKSKSSCCADTPVERSCPNTASVSCIHQVAASSNSKSTQGTGALHANPEVSGSAETCTSIFNFCWRSKKGVTTPAHNDLASSDTSSRDPPIQDLQNLSLVRDKQCTKAKTCELDKLLAASKTLTYYTCRKSLAAGNHSNSNGPCASRQGNSSAGSHHGNTEEVNVCPVTNSNRPLFTVACNRDNTTDLQALSKSSCNHGNHSEQPFFKFSISQDGSQSKLTLPKPQSCGPPKNSSHGDVPATGDLDNGYRYPVFHMTNSREGPLANNSVFKPVTAKETGQDDKSLFNFSSTNGHDVTPKPSPVKNTINHVENSPFQATDFYKSLSDPGCQTKTSIAQFSASSGSPVLATEEPSGSGLDSPPFIVHTGKPNLQKSKSAGTSGGQRGHESPDCSSTSPKPLFTIGMSMSPKAVKRSGRGHRSYVGKKP